MSAVLAFLSYDFVDSLLSVCCMLSCCAVVCFVLAVFPLLLVFVVSVTSFNLC